MLKIVSNSNVYVACPAYNKTGGTELAHQLVCELNKKGIKSYILYYDVDKVKDNKVINSEFLKYVEQYKILSDIDDFKENVLIVPEINISLLNKFRNLQKVIWWMSVDNFLKRDGFRNCVHYFGFVGALKLILRGKVSFKRKNIEKINADNFYQSEYARKFLLSHGLDKNYELSDFINQSYLNKTDFLNKENIVLYNPKKGFNFTKLLIERSKGIKWIPIKNMTNNDVKNFLLRSKVYIDFGNHPGKDRLPREAAICGCCIITGFRGSAKYYKDIPIPQDYKFVDSFENVDLIIKKIMDCFKNYDVCIEDFEEYREMISNEYEIFQNDIDKIFLND